MRRAPIPLTLALAASVLVTVGALPASAEPVVQAQLVQTIDTSAFDPPSPDPSGLAFLPSGQLLMSDGEVDETPHWEKRNVWIFSVDGDVAKTFRTTKYSTEPAGIEATKKQLYVADDVKDAIFVVKRGKDHGTARGRQGPVVGTGRLDAAIPRDHARYGSVHRLGERRRRPSVCRRVRGGTVASTARYQRRRWRHLVQDDPTRAARPEGIAYRPSTRTPPVSSLRNSPT
jgi:hypothetical protein